MLAGISGGLGGGASVRSGSGGHGAQSEDTQRGKAGWEGGVAGSTTKEGRLAVGSSGVGEGVDIVPTAVDRPGGGLRQGKSTTALVPVRGISRVVALGC